MKKNIAVAFISDNNYAVNTAVAITSLKHNRSVDIHYNVFLISDNISTEKIDRIRCLEDIDFSLTIIEYTNNMSDFSKKGRCASVSALAKFFLADIIKNFDKVVYVDGDVIIQSDLRDLYNIDLIDNYAAAVRDIFVEKEKPYLVKSLNKKYYFNSGMMVLNLKKMREDNIGEKLLEYKQNKLNYFMDQDALNAVFGNNVIYVDYKYNYMVSLYQIKVLDNLSPDFDFDTSKTEVERIVEADIVHFAGINKPWDAYMPYLTDIFVKYYRLSPFSNILNFSQMYQTQYLFPFELVEKNSRIAIWGAGKVGIAFYMQVKYTNYCDVVLWIDKNATDTRLQEKDVVSPYELKKRQFDYIVIAVKNEEIAKRIKVEIFDLIGKFDNVIWRYPEILYEE